MTSAWHLQVGARSDTGPVRAHNEDSAAANPRFALLADGVGGGPAGDAASSTVVRELADLVGSCRTEEQLRRDIVTANAAIASVARQSGTIGMATTLTGIVPFGEGLAVVHVGDSRAYLLHDGALSQVTRDDSWVQTLVDEARITPVEAAHHPMRHLILHSLSGSPTDPEFVSTIPYEACPGDRWVLVSDGVSDYLDPASFAAVIERESDPQRAADEIVRRAWLCTRDNVSVVVADVTAGEASLEPTLFIGAALSCEEAAS